jgi:hypothetical protein
MREPYTRRLALRQVYFITDGEQIKIGWSRFVEKRLRELQGLRKKPLKLIAMFPGDIADETALHRYFRHLRIKGEWFKRDREIYVMIDILESARLSLRERRFRISDVTTGGNGERTYQLL